MARVLRVCTVAAAIAAVVALASAVMHSSSSAAVGPAAIHPLTAKSLWISPTEIAALPTSGAAWVNLKRAADHDLSGGVLSRRDEHNVRTMAAALVAARLNSNAYRARVREALRGVMTAKVDVNDELAICRRLGTYAIAASLINLPAFDPIFDKQFRRWLDTMRKTEYPRGSIAAIHERRPNNWGTHAGVSRIAAALYLSDRAELRRAARVFQGWLGDRSAYAGFTYTNVEYWQADPRRPVGINPKGSARQGHSIDGVLPDDQRRGGTFKWPPPKENYVYTALEGALGQAVLLSRQGYDVWNWSERALLRAFTWLHEQAHYPAEGNDGWQPHIINRVYGTSFPAPPSSKPGKNVGWTDWTHQE